ncbi:MAG: hypothetical protein HY848_10585 [Betaproteobacteria bacterium]|nr:hypothetical protein [Betaproteobacteria bacterium]
MRTSKDLPLTTSEEAERYRRSGAWPDETVYERLERFATRFADKRATVETHRRLTYLNRGGRNIRPRLIEELVMRHPQVAEVAVAADPVLCERACAFVVLGKAVRSRSTPSSRSCAPSRRPLGNCPNALS